jgi:hypothetical protein
MPVVRCSNSSFSIPSITLPSAISIVCALKAAWTTAGWGFASVIGSDYSSGTLGFDFLLASTGGQDWGTKNIVFYGEGYNSGRAPRAFGTWGSLADNTSHIFSGSIGASLSRIWLDGSIVSMTESTGAVGSQTSALEIASNNAGSSDYFIGDIAEIILYSGTLSTGDRQGVEAYLAGKYGLPISGTSSQIASLIDLQDHNGTTLIHVDGSGNFIVGAGNVIDTGGTGLSFTNPAPLSVNASLAANATGSEHYLTNTWFAQNVLAIQNQHSGGFSAARFLRYTGEEMGAIGYAQPNDAPWGGPNGSDFWEFSNFHSESTWGDFRLVQSQSSVARLRSRIRGDTNAIEEYDLTWTEPGSSNPSAGLTSLRSLPVASVANNATTNTYITTPAFGIVIVKDRTNNKSAVYAIENTTLTALSADAEFSTSSGNSGTVNVYNSSGQLILQNKTGGPLNLTAAYYGA